MNLIADHISYKKNVGTLKGKPVIELATTGGLHMIVTAQNGGVETLGTGPHRGVARYIAEQHEPDIIWTELSKADYLDPEHFAFCLPAYQELTERMRRLGQE
jgi:hypothetical protein